MDVLFSKRARREWEKLDASVREQLLKKFTFFIASKNFLYYADKLMDRNLGEYRFRIGDYRMIFDIEKDGILILKVGYRKDIYK